MQIQPIDNPDGCTIFDRLLVAYGVAGPKELADLIGEELPTVKGWKQRDSVPMKHCVKAWRDTKRSLDWLVLGLDAKQTASNLTAMVYPPGGVTMSAAVYIASEDAPPWYGDKPTSPHSRGARGKSDDATLERAALLRNREAGAVRPLMLSLPVGEQGGPTEDYELIPKHVRTAAAGAGTVRAGSESDQVNLVGEMAFSFDWMRRNLGHTSGNLTSIQVRGDSMAATLLDGDTIVIDEGVQGVEVDGIYVLDVLGRRLVKRVQHLVDGTLVLISDNQSYQRESIPRDQARSVRVIGRMVWPRVR